ncbi:MAG: AAA family ATPase [Candidatus Colwellbacteria bacterium]|nr:AAA family ATPase [Candidatus Colwellbacteria bacterium]
MYLKRLELSGFKSFASKTVFTFPAGITAVVGPNGSGKSNIIDGIRWLLGEREAKNMRSAKAGDLIFSGTKARPRMSVASATIVFDNERRFFPVDYAEVAIRRRVEADGSSQYFLNDSEVRLKDIIEFFASSRLGARGFSVINQGESDLFVRASPRERREMLEEILGLRQYQLKKHEAEVKLKGTASNMEQASAHIEEMLPHLRSLKRQTAKWEKRADVERELREIEDDYFSFKLKQIADEEASRAPELARLERETAEKKRELASLEKELKDIERSQPKQDGSPAALRDERTKLSERRAGLQRDLGRVEAHLEIEATAAPTKGADGAAAVTILEEAQGIIGDLLEETDLTVIKHLLQELSETINRFFESGSPAGREHAGAHDLNERREELMRQLAALEDEAKILGERERERDEFLTRFSAAFRRAFSGVEAKRQELHALEQEKSQLAFARERLQMRRDELAHYAGQSGRSLKEFERVAAPDGLDERAGESRLLSLRGALAAIGEVDENLVREAKEVGERYEHMSTQLQDLEKAHRGLIGLIGELDGKIHRGFDDALKQINAEFQNYFHMMFSGGHAKLTMVKPEPAPVTGGGESVTIEDEGDARHAQDHGGLDISVSIPRKRIAGLDMLSGGEKALVSLAVLFALISVSPPPFLVLDEVDAALDEENTHRFADLIKTFAKKTQFLVVTHNRATMEAADILYGITMQEDGTSKVLSLKLE